MCSQRRADIICYAIWISPRYVSDADTIQPVGISVKTVERHFIANPKRRYSKTSESNRQPNNADKRLAFVFPQVAE
jgi:hypothetical protein